MHSITDYLPDPSCGFCDGSGLVCEDHPNIAWDDGTGCCGAAGMPCRCNLWPCGARGAHCDCGGPTKAQVFDLFTQAESSVGRRPPYAPSWYANAKRRGEVDDRLGYWCRRTVASIEAGNPALYVTEEEYLDLRKALDFAPDTRFNGLPSGEIGHFDSYPVAIIRDISEE